MKKLGACQFKNRINMKGRDHHWLTRDHILFRVSFCFCGEDDGIKNKRATFSLLIIPRTCCPMGIIPYNQRKHGY